MLCVQRLEILLYASCWGTAACGQPGNVAQLWIKQFDDYVNPEEMQMVAYQVELQVSLIEAHLGLFM